MKTLLFISISVLAGIIILEIAFNIVFFILKKRFFWQTRSPYRFDKDIGYRVKENLAFEMLRQTKNNRDSKKAYYHTGKYGFRWYPSASEGKTFWFVGDSFTEAVYFPNQDTFCGILYSKLGRNTRVVNSGLGGCRQVHMFEIVKKFADRIKPQTLFVQISHNDFYDIALELSSPRNKYTHRLNNQIGKNNFLQFLDNIIIFCALKKFLSGKIHPPKKINEKSALLATYANSQEWFENIIEYCKQINRISIKNGFRAIFYIPPSPLACKFRYGDEQERFNEIGIISDAALQPFQIYYSRLKDLKNKLSNDALKIFNANDLLDGMDAKSVFELFIDRSHLSQAGHNWFAEFLASVIEKEQV